MRTASTIAQTATWLLVACCGNAAPKTCEALSQGLHEKEPGKRDDAARQLFRDCGKTPPASAEAGLRQLITEGTPVAGAFLLLGTFPASAQNKAAFQAALEGKGAALDEGPPVNVGLVIAVATGEVLGTRVATRDLPERQFLLRTASYIKAPADLAILRTYLDDTREIRGGVPSGPGPAKRRLCDLAVETLSKRAGWTPSFPLNPSRRYTADEIAAVKAALSKRWPPE